MSRHWAYAPYYWSIVALGFGPIALSVFQLSQNRIAYQWIILASLTLLTGCFTIKIPGVTSKISVADSFVLTNLILFGPAAGVITAALDGFVGSIRSKTSSRRLEYMLFNVAAISLSSFLAGEMFFRMIGRGPLYQAPAVSLDDILLPMGAMTLILYLSNSGSIAGVVALEMGKNVYSVWRESFLWTSLTYFLGASVAIIIALNIGSITPAALAFVVAVLLITYLTYTAYLDKFEQTTKNLKELNKLYLNTLETLAMAIDAKDQVTHGHVRKVQIYARGLAKAMGITDENALRGVEAAALLHDIGKLAIPEYILNKPGELTHSEYRKMMIHPAVGSDILASINFPYPVADYVRHHHEHWDGSGYPDRLSGSQIPLGARILAVVDCYEALTSDRPYRAGYNRERAMQIVRSRSGKHYDPEVVRKFDQILDQLVLEAQEIEARELNVEGLKAIADARDSEKRSSGRVRDLLVFQNIASTQKEVLALYELAQTLGSTLNLHETLTIIASKISNIVPFTTCVIYLYSTDKARLRAEHISGANAEAFENYSMARGDNLSGWVAAHNQPAINADPFFDVALLKEKLTVDLNNSMVYPLIFERKCLGTISLYTTDSQRFKDDHIRVMEIVSKQAATAVHNALRFEETQEDAFTDRLTSLPNSRYLHLYFEQELQNAIRYQYPVTVLGMDLDGLKAINDSYGHQAGDRVLKEVARILKSNARNSDVVVRYAGDEFVAIMTQTPPKDALLLALRIQAMVDEFRLEVEPGKWAAVGISIGLASYPEDGDTLDLLMTKADCEMYRDKETRNRYCRLAPRQLETSIPQVEFNDSAHS